MGAMKHVTLVLIGTAALLQADFTLEQTSRMTGGTMLQMMRMVPGAAKRITEPNPSTTAVKGNKMAHTDRNATAIWDLDGETITRVDHDKKEYSVITFAQMRQAMQKMQNMRVETAKADLDLDYKFEAKETGRNKTIAGQKANETLLLMEIEAAEKKSRQATEMETQISAWIATAKIAGYEEVTAFYQKIAQAMSVNPGSMGNPVAFAGRPEVARAMAAVAAKMQKMNGTPVMQIVRMGPRGQLPPSETFGESPEGAADRGLLMEMTTETTSLSNAPVDAAKFTVPAGYKQIDDPMVKRLR